MIEDDLTKSTAKAPNPSYGNNVRNVNTSGALNNNKAYNGNGSVVDYNSCQSKVGKSRNQRILSCKEQNSSSVRKNGETRKEDADILRDSSAIYSFSSLYHGLKMARRGVLWKYGPSSYSMNGLRNTLRLRESLLHGTYRIQDYQVFYIHEPKERRIVATRIKDRQFQRSLCDSYLYKAVTKSFIHDNCACQKGKGVDFALNRMDAHLHKFYRDYGQDGWYLKCDIHHYFAETAHETAKKVMRERIDNEAAYFHVCQIIDSFDEGDKKGIGLGSQVSQLIELAVLDKLDHFIKEHLGIKHYIRYMDDFILLSKDKTVLKNALFMIEQHLVDLGLHLNRKTQLQPIGKGIEFLKWKFTLTPTGKVVRRMNRCSITRERRKVKRLELKLYKGEIEWKDLNSSVMSWRANALRGNCYKVVHKMDILCGGIHERYTQVKGTADTGAATRIAACQSRKREA